MVINTHYRFIFVHVPKTAGTSMMKCLSQLKGNHTNWTAKTKHETLAEFERAVRRRRSVADRFLGRNPLRYFRFGFVRNPWDRMSSFYHYLVEKRPKKEIDSVSSFKDFLRQSREGRAWINDLYSMKPQVEYFTVREGILAMDYLGHFEYLEEDTHAVEKLLGCSIHSPHLNRSSNSDRDYRDEYDLEMMQIVAERFADDIRHFGYLFDQTEPTKRCSGPLNGRR